MEPPPGRRDRDPDPVNKNLQIRKTDYFKKSIFWNERHCYLAKIRIVWKILYVKKTIK